MAIAKENREFQKMMERLIPGHTGRKTQFLFWNIIHRKERVLLYSNHQGKDLDIINDPNTIVKMAKVKDIESWERICEVIDKVIGRQLGTREQYVIRVDILMSYLKKIEYDLDKLDLTTSSEKSIYFTTTRYDKKKGEDITVYHHVAFPPFTIHNVFFMKKAKELLLQPLQKASHDNQCICTEITEDYMNSETRPFEFEVMDKGKPMVMVPLIEGADAPPVKYIKTDIKESKNPPVLKIIQMPGKVARFLYIYRSQKIDILSCRFYLNYFLDIKGAKK